MKKLLLKLEAGTAEISLLSLTADAVTQPLPTALELVLDVGQHAVIRHIGGDELRIAAINAGDEVHQVDLVAEDGSLTERYTLFVGARTPGNSVILHGWEGDYFVLGEVPPPAVETLAAPVVPMLPAPDAQLGEAA